MAKCVSKAMSINLAIYLSFIGHNPNKITGNSHWYFSQLRKEYLPSFKINRSLNRWYDFGEGKDDNIVDFGIEYHNCSFKYFLEKLEAEKIYLATLSSLIISSDLTNNIGLRIISIKLISSTPLIRYHDSGKIQLTLAVKFLSEAAYKYKERYYYSMAFKNDSGGYSLRNQCGKLSTSPKTITFIVNGADMVFVFEDFLNFLTYLSLDHKGQIQHSHLVHNSTAFLEHALPILYAHKAENLYLYGDASGKILTQQAIAIDPVKFRDQSPPYEKYNDFNRYLCNRPLNKLIN